jgi:sn-glycerol 3-phosphate transport system permease protein
MLLPALLLLALFTYYPALGTLWDSFYSTPRNTRPAVFVGMDQFATLMDDPVFWQALYNNIIYAVVTVPLSCVIALAMALIVNAGIRAQGLVRAAYFIPTILPMVAVADVWLFFYAPDYGLLDSALAVFGIQGKNWTGDPSTALGAIMAVTVWKEAGLFMIFYLAALQQIPTNLVEAAKLEGANAWQRLYKVVLPLIMPTTLFVVINATINAIRMVDHVFIMTKGGPDNASVLLLYYIYRVAFMYWDTGYGAAVSVVVLATLAIIAIFQFVFADKRIHYR